VIAELLYGVATYCPTAFVCIITNPVNSTVPIAVEVLKKASVFNPRKVFGITTLDVVRASTFVAHVLGEENPQKFKVPVVGGHSGATILPLFSQSEPSVELTKEQRDAITHRECDVIVLKFTCPLTLFVRRAVWRRRDCEVEGWCWLCHYLHGLRRISVSYIPDRMPLTREEANWYIVLRKPLSKQ
jgi:hypothetical protein